MNLDNSTREQLLDEVRHLQGLLAQSEAERTRLAEQLALRETRCQGLPEIGPDKTRQKGPEDHSTETPGSRDTSLTLLDDFSTPIWRPGVDAKCNYSPPTGPGKSNIASCGRTDRSDGSGTAPFRCSTSPARSAGLRRIGEDITERRQSEETLQEYVKRVKALSRQILTVQEEERRRLAHELHDEIGQMLSLVAIRLHAARELVAGAERPKIDLGLADVDRAIQLVRNLSLDLRPVVLDDFGLEAALRWYCESIQDRSDLHIHLSSVMAGPRLPPAAEIACFRIVQGTITNILRHSGADRAQIDIQQNESVLELVVRDKGKGFDVENARQRSLQGGCFGLFAMQERASLLGGELVIESQPGQGTTVRGHFPMTALLTH